MSKISKAIDLFGNLLQKEIDCFIRETKHDLSVYSITDGLTDDLLKALRLDGMTIVSSPHNDGFRHFVKFCNFEQTKERMNRCIVKSIPRKNIIHLDRFGVIIKWTLQTIV